MDPNQTHKLSPSSKFLILSACLLLLLSFGFRSGFGLFVKPITDANGWGRETISMALAIQNLFWGIVSVFAGGLADRFGNVKVIIGGTLLYSAGIWLTAGIESIWLLHSSIGILVGAGIAGTSFGIVLPAMARAVPPERRQWALGVGTSMGSLGQFAVVPAIQGLIDARGWTSALHILALTALFMAALAMPLAKYSGTSDNSGGTIQQTVGQALREAFGHGSYILLVSGFFVCGFHVAFITAHMPAFLTDAGFAPRVGAWSIALIGLCNVAGAYISGVVSGKVPKRHLLCLIYFARAVTITAFMLIPLTLVSVLTFSAVMGFLWLATVPPTSGLVAVMFGTRYMALLYGFVFLSHQVGSFIGVWLGGMAFDRTGSYDSVWWLGVGFSIMATLVHWPIREEPVARLAEQGPML